MSENVFLYIRCGGVAMLRPNGKPKALVGAKAIAVYAFDDEEKWRWVYTLKDDLGLFYMRGRLCGNPDTIDARLRAREAAGNAT
jgi:hypothetical protein